MKSCSLVLALATFAACLPALSIAGDSNRSADATAKWMIEQETAWAEQECGQKWVIANLLADDFRGTSPAGKRYSKAEAEAREASSSSHATDCRLLDSDVRFFGSSTAIIYGSETALESPPAGKPERYCLIWTDTWLKRGGKWQIVAAQDALITCPPM
jgi:Domain of unknown function (DUF4440)